MSNKSPIFPMTNELHHFTDDDYGFHPQFHYFQLLEEARKHRRENPSIDALHLKLQNPNSKDHHHHLDSFANNKKKTKKIKIIKKIHTCRKRWWKTPLLFFRGIWASAHKTNRRPNSQDYVHPIRRPLPAPLYITESRSDQLTTSRPYSGQLVKREMDIIPYISLRDLNMDHHHRISPMPMPIYLVT